MRNNSDLDDLVDCIRLEGFITDDQAKHIGEAIQERFAGRRIYVPAKPGIRRRDEKIRALALRLCSEGAGVTDAAKEITRIWASPTAAPQSMRADLAALKRYKPISPRQVLRIVSETPPQQDEAIGATLDALFCHWHRR